MNDVLLEREWLIYFLFSCLFIISVMSPNKVIKIMVSVTAYAILVLTLFTNIIHKGIDNADYNGPYKRDRIKNRLQLQN